MTSAPNIIPYMLHHSGVWSQVQQEQLLWCYKRGHILYKSCAVYHTVHHTPYITIFQNIVNVVESRNNVKHFFVKKQRCLDTNKPGGGLSRTSNTFQSSCVHSELKWVGPSGLPAGYRIQSKTLWPALENSKHKCKVYLNAVKHAESQVGPWSLRSVQEAEGSAAGQQRRPVAAVRWLQMSWLNSSNNEQRRAHYFHINNRNNLVKTI